MKKVYIVHGWGGSSDEAWFPWLKKELEAKGFEATVFAMPDTENPKIETWVKYLEDNIPNPDAETILIGHSIGCQTILKYLEKLPEGVKVGKVIIVAPWYTLTEYTYEEYPEDKEEMREIARPWLETPINEQKVLEHINEKVVCIFSDNDPYVALEENKKIFEEKYQAETIVEHDKGHFSGDDGITELPVVLEKN
jgi:uncharacterized protein